ncbi:hypothetical protein Tco_1021512 [Tanacetum coccineum]
MDLMNRVCKPYLGKFVMTFMNDIFIYLKRNEEHGEHLRINLELLKNKELYVKFSKCKFWLPKVQFSDHIVDSQGIHGDSAKYYNDVEGEDQREFNVRPRRWLKLLCDYDCKIRYHPGKANGVADALNRKEQAKPLRNVKVKNLHGMDKEFENCLDGTLCIRNQIAQMARHRGKHRHLCQQVLDMFKDEGRLPDAIQFTSTTRNTPLEMGKYSHGFYHKTTKDNKQL